MWSTLTTLESDHLPITVSLSSYAPPSLQKAHSYTNFHKADWEGFTAESERRFAETPMPTSCSAGKIFFSHILSDAGRHHIICGYVGDYCDPLPDIVRPLIAERDQLRKDDPLDPSIKLLDRDIQRLMWRVLRPRHQSQALLVSSGQARQQEVESPIIHLNRL